MSLVTMSTAGMSARRWSTIEGGRTGFAQLLMFAPNLPIPAFSEAVNGVLERWYQVCIMEAWKFVWFGIAVTKSIITQAGKRRDSTGAGPKVVLAGYR